jgi:aspartate carbamoyltransferase catalytic subunit
MGTTDLRLTAPPGLEPDPANYPGALITEDIDAAIEGADVVMALRVQRERMEDGVELPDNEEYLETYGLTEKRLKLARPDAIVMHPGPMNRGVEIPGSVADGPQSVIAEQVTNGLAVRMAILATISTPRADP